MFVCVCMCACVIVLYFTTHCCSLPLMRRMASSAGQTVTFAINILEDVLHALSTYCSLLLQFTTHCAAETVTFAINVLYLTTCAINILYFTTYCCSLPLIRRMASSAAATVTRTVKIWAVRTLRTSVPTPPAHTTKKKPKKMLSRRVRL
jgi:hypothetical protein